LEEVCVNDEELRREMESMPATNSQAGDFLEIPAVEAAAHVLMPLSAGTRLGPYEIVCALGIALGLAGRFDCGVPHAPHHYSDFAK
jgi:hypothetical protein